MEKIKQKVEPISEQALLMQALKFDQDDLAANRMGQLSAGNVTRLRRQLILFAVYLLVAVLVVVWAANGIPTFMAATASEQTVSLVLVIVGLVIGLFSLVRAVLYGMDLYSGLTESVQGVVRLDVKAGKSRSYALIIGEKHISVSHDVYNAFKTRDPYALYFTHSSGTLLAAEPLRTD